MESKRPEIIICKDSLEFYSKAAGAFINLSSFFQAKNGSFSVALSGGTTPMPLYALLGLEAFREKVNWSGVHFFWSDERCLPPDDEHSNYGNTALNLLDKLDIDDNNIHRIKGELGEAAGPAYERELRRVFGTKSGELPCFDLILLGMGGDGHTASLFPGSASVKEKVKLVTAEYVKKLASTRVTFTPPLIQNAANIIFLVKGGEKAAVVRAVLESPYNPSVLPVSLTLRAAGRVRWFLDKDAASML